MYLQARKRFYWPNMHQHIAAAIDGCAACRQSKARKATKQVPLGQTSTKERTHFTTFHCDLVGPWPNTRGPGTKKYLLNLQDAVTKYPEEWPIADATAENIVKVLTKEFFPRYGVGMRVISNQGRQFTSALFQNAARRLGVFSVTTQTYEPKTNPVEWLHRTLENAIGCKMESEQAHPTQWHQFVPAALASIRQAPVAYLGTSPHFLTFGSDPVIPADVLVSPSHQPSLTIDQDFERLRQTLEGIKIK
ncbi:uncharacterized protein LOC131878190 [Tigriopus californicus]|uniref:uncharacterized protein LOC131878190 n=1 Tax=Tigriopus californicus TaxID=6832 RepID=UPI0027DA1BDA|nr:uncharacterized protein LOC131878190 [Tigriopus californicus]